MADQLLAEPPPLPTVDHESDSVPIHHMFDDCFSDMGLELDIGDLGFNFDDLDDLCLPSDVDHFFLPDFSPISPLASAAVSNHSGCSPISGNDFPDYATSQNPESAGDCIGDLSGGPVSSQGSGNLPADSGIRERDVSSHVVIEHKLKVEKMGKISLSKRKKELSDANSESRTTKYRRSLTEIENVTAQSSLDGFGEDEGKRNARLIRNRESAQLSRQRKKHYVEELEDKVRAMHSTIADLNSKISFVVAENANLRLQLGNSGMCPPPPPGMYPHPSMVPMPYPWMSCGPYVVNPRGSQVPLVPIPKLKTQQPTPVSKAKKPAHKKDSKAKKVASISFLGLLFFILLFGGLAPIVNVKYGAIRDEIGVRLPYAESSSFYPHQGKLLTVNGHSNGSDHSRGRGFSSDKFDVASKINCEISHGGLSNSDVRGSKPEPRAGSDEFAIPSNASEPLVASLYVPRNDKLVKIDGNLIIQSVLASEKAMASRLVPEMIRKETSLAIPRNIVPTSAISEVGMNGRRHPHSFNNPTDRQKSLGSSSSDDSYKLSAGYGALQQWFHEGLAGPLLSSGRCHEVFSFDVLSTSASGAIIPASSVVNISSQNRENVTYFKGKNRRILNNLPVPVVRSNLNVTEESVRSVHKEGIEANKSASSVVVSVLIDPREVGDSDGDGMVAPKSLSRIFVVVLMDSVKYFTYSCMLPRSEPHLVIT